MLEQLFGSKTRLKLLRIFFREEDRPFFVRELTRALDTQINAVRRELATLVAIGLVEEIAAPSTQKFDDEETGVSLRKYYRLNKSCVIFAEMQALLIKSQLLEEQVFIQELKEKGGNIRLLLLTGKFTGEKYAPSDMLIVGDVKEKVVSGSIQQYEKEFGFEVRYTIMSEQEFHDRRHIMDKFLYTLFEAKHMLVVNHLIV